MKKEILKSYEIVLSEKEAASILICLDYCYHRLTTEKKCGISRVMSPETVGALRGELRKLAA